MVDNWDVVTRSIDRATLIERTDNLPSLCEIQRPYDTTNLYFVRFKTRVIHEFLSIYVQGLFWRFPDSEEGRLRFERNKNRLNKKFTVGE